MPKDKKKGINIVIPKQDFHKVDQFDVSYEIIEKIGEGQHGYVEKIKFRETGQLFACKVIKNLDPEIIEICRNEYESLSKLSHPNIVKVKDFFVNENKAIRIVMEFLECETLTSFLEKKKFKKEGEVVKIFTQIFDCLAYMHSSGLCHRDLNPSNIMIADSLQIKLIDFSVSKWFMINQEAGQMWTPTGTPAYKAPELFQGGEYQESVDIWAAGVIMFECLVGKKPFMIGKSIDKLISQIDKGFENITEQDAKNLSPLATDLLAKMLKTRPELRIKSQEALEHQWIRRGKNAEIKEEKKENEKKSEDGENEQKEEGCNRKEGIMTEKMGIKREKEGKQEKEKRREEREEKEGKNE